MGFRMIRAFISEQIYTRSNLRQDSGTRYGHLQSILGSNEIQWHACTLLVDCRKIARQWKKDCDSFDPRWIVKCPLALIKDPAYCFFSPDDEFPPAFFRGCKSVGDITTIQWLTVGVVAFSPSKRASLYPTVFSHFCLLVISVFPEIIFPWSQEFELLPLSPNAENLEFVWEARLLSSSVECSAQHWTQPPVFVKVQETLDLRRLSTFSHQLQPKPHCILLHPLLDTMFWPFSQLPLPTDACFTQFAKRRQHTRTLQSLKTALSGWVKASECGEFWCKLDWKRIAHTLSGLSVSEVDFWRRFRLRRLPVWRPRHEPACGNVACPTNTVGDSFDHIFWTCETAVTLWAHITQQWGRLGPFPTTSWKSMICTGVLHQVCFPLAQHALSLLESRHCNVPPMLHLLICDLAYEVANRAWLVVITSAMRFLWFSRNTLVHDPAQHVPGTLIPRLDSFLHVRLRTDKEAYTKTASGLELLARRILVDAIVLQVTSPLAVLASQPLRYASWFIMFFDGGSRGNPGPGGAGACVVNFTNNEPTLVWAQATYLPETSTTNNYAELTAAECGLRKLRFFNPQVCTIIGDSHMLITLFSRHKRPKADHLVDLFKLAQRSANALPIREWRHHLRAHNTMADALANFAMDTKTTSTLWPTTTQYLPPMLRLLLTKLQNFCASDLQPWLLTAADWRPP